MAGVSAPEMAAAKTAGEFDYGTKWAGKGPSWHARYPQPSWFPGAITAMR
jgi:hypothetical protein